MPDEREIERLWKRVDPYADIVEKFELLESALFTQLDPNQPVSGKVLEVLRPWFGNRISTFEDMRREYGRIFEEGGSKKNSQVGIETVR